MKRKTIKKLAAVAAALVIASVGIITTGCGSSDSAAEGNNLTIAVPNDPTNEARALLLLEKNGYIDLKDGAGITATISDIEDTNGIEFKEVEAAQVANTLPDVDFGIINSNYAIEADLNPVKDSLIIEDSAADYANILAVKEGNEETNKTKALVAALQSQAVADFITEKYDGAVVSVVDNPGNGYDASVDYSTLEGETISVAASPAPHAEILAEAAKILEKKGVTLDIQEFTDYIQPNKVVDSGEVDANYFQHIPYLDDFNKENGTAVVSVLAVHNEPMGLYAGKTESLENVVKLEK